MLYLFDYIHSFFVSHFLTLNVLCSHFGSVGTSVAKVVSDTRQHSSEYTEQIRARMILGNYLLLRNTLFFPFNLIELKPI